MPELAQAPDGTRWPDGEALAALLRPLDVRPAPVRVDHVVFRFDSPEEAVAALRTHSGPGMMLFDLFEARGLADEGVRILAHHLRPDIRRGGLRVAYGVSRFQRPT